MNAGNRRYPPPRAVRGGRNGFALIVVIWMLTLLSLMAGSFALTMRRANSVTMALKNNAQAVALTESSLNMAIQMLQQPDPAQNWLADGSIYRIVRDDGSEIRISIVSESGKIDINMADPNLLLAAISELTGDKWQQQQLLNSLLDWRDADDEPNEHGAERKAYQEAGLGYGPGNQPFQSLDELQLVMGFNADIVSRLQSLFTVYSGQKDVDLNVASPLMQEIVANAMLGSGQSSARQTPAGNNAAAANPQGGGQNAGQAANNANSTYNIVIEVLTEDGGSASLETVVRLPAPAAAPGGSSGQAAAPSPPPAPNTASPGQQSEGGAQLAVLDWKQNQLQESLFSSSMDARLITVRDEFTNYN